MVKHYGPKIFDRAHYSSFVSKYKESYIEGDRVYTLRPRHFSNPLVVFLNTINEKEGIGKNMKDMPFRILKDDRALTFLSNEDVDIYF